MTTTDPWDDLEPRSEGSFFKFDQPGDTIVGTIVRREKGTKFDKVTPCPQLVIDTDSGEQIVTCSQTNLETQALLKKAELVPGARVRITFTGVGQAKPGQAPPKLFTIETKGGEPQLTDGEMKRRSTLAASEDDF